MELKLICIIFFRSHFHYLLIVPYGIETKLVLEGMPLLNTFNCTLWN